ncbi:MAG: hypothetical protein K2Y71_00800 [Xanthobacteraceae bacterium]|nr:hypothetical protein [Xanthobacteraceae bacterium]
MTDELRALGSHPDMDEETLQIIVRHRPEFAGKTLDECRAILRALYPGKRAAKPASAP